MLVPRQQYPRELKMTTMRELDSGKSVWEVARTYQVSPKRLETWRGEWRARGEHLAFPGHAAQSQPKLDAPRAGTQNRTTGDGDRLFKKSLAAFQGASPAHHRQWRRRIYEMQSALFSLHYGPGTAPFAVPVPREHCLDIVQTLGIYRF
jgi:transposase-like protein